MFFNCRNGQFHLLRYFRHGFFMDAAKNEGAAALRRQGIDDRLHLAKGVAGVELRFHAGAGLKQLKIGDGFETDHLVAAGIVDHQVARNGEKIGTTGGNALPCFAGISPRHDFRHHIVQFMMARQNPSQTGTKRGFVRQQTCLEPF